MTYKTPGVYVEEISKFPPSVAQVETAIPAFIGYTEKAKNKLPGDLNLVPTRISSLLEYQTYFGFPENETKISVIVNADGTIIVNGPAHSERSPFIMYYSMQMYFANGGGPCWITSVGTYNTSGVDFQKLIDGLDEVRKLDEPTLLVFPDATFLGAESDFYEVYKAALKQCGELQDRFTILDTYTDAKSSIADFRAGINSDPMFLKYGGAYYPYLNTILNYSYLDSQVQVQDPNAPSYTAQVNTISNSIDVAPLHTLVAELESLKGSIPATGNIPVNLKVQIVAKVQEIQTYISSIKGKLTDASAIGTEAIDDNTGGLPIVNLGLAIDALDDWSVLNLDTPQGQIQTELNAIGGLVSASAIATRVETIILKLVPLSPALSMEDKIKAMKSPTPVEGELPALGRELIPFVNENDASLASYELNNNVKYNAIKAEIGKLPVVLPSSSAMAGVYARVDNLIGVWKAPANVGLNYVISPSQLVSNKDQDDMNVTSTGKSINAIRSFTGKGTLVWGARTLTGNSNEWRYISVRRFFNMVEESVSEASEQFVFESNDANTWVRIRAMIENFLILQWKAGALTGAKPEQAFYVRIGLGQTMTAEDILNGYMIIEIGMAVVRPAEFIVLRFSHKMQEA